MNDAAERTRFRADYLCVEKKKRRSKISGGSPHEENSQTVPEKIKGKTMRCFCRSGREKKGIAGDRRGNCSENGRPFLQDSLFNMYFTHRK